MKITRPITVGNIELEQVRSQLREWQANYERVSDHFAALTQARLVERRHVIDQLKAASGHLDSGNVAIAKAAIVKLLNTLQRHRGSDSRTLFDVKQENLGGTNVA